MKRRAFLRTAAGTSLAVTAVESASADQEVPTEQSGAVAVDWLDGTPLSEAGVSWGVPWPRGKVRKDQCFTLTASDGKALPLQSWPLAYWPDGSLKWSGLATVAGAGGDRFSWLPEAPQATQDIRP